MVILASVQVYTIYMYRICPVCTHSSQLRGTVLHSWCNQNKLNSKLSWKHDILLAYNNTHWYVTVTYLFSQALNELWFLFHRGPQLSLLTSRLHQRKIITWIWLYWLVCRYIQCTCTGYVQYAHTEVNWEELCYTPGAIQNKLNSKLSWKHDINFY